ncbi:MAG: transporter [Verrucomicrobiaceae bacterium]|nr:transporter [Verrucomicrobiaceae bacterium]
MSAPEAPVPDSAQVGAIPYWRLSSFYFFYFALLGSWLPYWPLYLRDLGYSAAAIGVLAGTLQGTKVIAPNLWGWLADRSGERLRIVRLGAVAAVLIFSLIFFRSGFAWLVVIVAGYSFFWNAVHAQFEVITLGHLREQVQRYSLVRVWGSIGFIVAVLVLGWLFDQVALRTLPFILLALLLAIWGSTLSIAKPPAINRAAVQQRDPLRMILRQPAVLAFFAINFLLQVSHGPYYTFFSVYLESHHYSRTQTGLLWSLGVIAEVAMFLLMHRVLRRVSLRAIVIGSLALTALRWFLIARYVDVLPILLFAQCLHAVSFASQHACAVEMVRRSFAGGNEGQGMALYSGVCYGGGAAVGAVLSGLLWAGQPTATFYGAAVVVLIALLIAYKWLRPLQRNLASVLDSPAVSA